MNDINDLFDGLFGDEANRQTALLYLASLMAHTEDPGELAAKRKQAEMLRDYLGKNEVPNKAFYRETV